MPAPNINGTNGIHKTQNGVTYKVADQMNGSSTYGPQVGHDSPPTTKLNKAQQKAASDYQKGAERLSRMESKAEEKGRGLLAKGVNVAQQTVNLGVKAGYMGIGAAAWATKAVASLYINGTIAAASYTASRTAHYTRVGVNKTAYAVGYGLGLASEATKTVVDVGLDVAGYAVGSATAVLDKTGHIAHETSSKFLPVPIATRVDQAADVASRARTSPLETAKEVLPGQVFDTVVWGIESANQAKDRTQTTLTELSTTLTNTAAMLVNTTVSNLKKTEDYTYNLSLRNIEEAKGAVGFGVARGA